MPLYINNIEITERVVRKIDNDALNGAYEFAADSGHDNHIEFTPMDGIRDIDLAYEYITERAIVPGDSKIMLHIWYHHSEYINENNQTQLFDSTIDKYGESEIIKLWIQQKFGSKDKIYKMYTYVDKMYIRDMPSKYILKYCGINIVKYDERLFPFNVDLIGRPIKELFNIYAGEEYTFISIWDNLIEELKSGNRKNIVISGDMHSVSNKLVNDLYEENIPLLTTEELATWRIGPDCTDLRYMFSDYPLELNVEKWQLSGLKNIIYLFENAILHESIKNNKLYSCIRASCAFEGSNIRKLPDTYNLEYATNIVSNCSNIEDISNIKSKKLNLDRLVNCPNLKYGLCDVTLNNYIEHIARCPKLEYLYKNCKVVHKRNGKKFVNYVYGKNMIIASDND